MLSNGIHIGRRGGVQLTGGGEETPWWLAGGISAGDVVAAYQPKGAASLAASYVNLANPGTYDLTSPSEPTWDAATGWAFGSGRHLRSGIILANRTGTVVVRFTNVTSGALCGCHTPGFTGYLQMTPTSTTNRSYYHGGQLLVAGAVSSGIMAVAGGVCYLDGVNDGSTAVAGSGNYNSLYFGGWNNSGNVSAVTNGKIQAAFVASSTLTAGQVAALSAAMAAL